MKSEEIRTRFLTFFEKREHSIIPSSSLVPENDPSVLFTTAGMQPLVPYLMGEKHPQGKRLANIQKCVRTQDIESVGDATHDTFFEMLGNWSLGDYFKEDTICWSYLFLTDKDEGLGLDKNRLYITCFAGDNDAPKDTKSALIWKSVGIPENRIYFLGKEDNWWSPGENGPCGPDTEMFYDITKDGLGDLSLAEFKNADSKQKVIEIWNDVFMEYEKKDGKIINKLPQKNVDTGAGMERLAMVIQKKDNIFDTDLFADLITKINTLKTDRDILLSPEQSKRADRIVADHIRTATFIIADGVSPSNTDRGYVLRRIVRRAIRYSNSFGFNKNNLSLLSDIVIKKYGAVYPNLIERRDNIKKEIDEEENKFYTTLGKGLKEFDRVKHNLDSKNVFNLFTTYGLPFEMIMELAQESGITADIEGAHKEFEKHQELSRFGSNKKFKGGLADASPMSTKYHTATHLLNQALMDVLGKHVNQRGSNINRDRLRFDFSHDKKMTDVEKKSVENIVNAKIKEDLPVTKEEISYKEAQERGAIGEFGIKYGDRVKVYSVGDKESRFSYEICGGPHVKHTGNMGKFKIIKEESVASGIRRIKAILE